MFLVHQMGVAMFRLMGAIGRTLVIATSMGSLAVLIIVTMSGFVLAYPQVRSAANHQVHCTLQIHEPGHDKCAIHRCQHILLCTSLLRSAMMLWRL